MKKLILILAVLFLSYGNVSAQNRTIQEITRKVIDDAESGIQLVCIENYKFIYTKLESAKSSYTSTMSQFLKR